MDAPAPARPASRLLRHLPLALALALWGALLGRTAFLIDDAFISFRYARNWVELGLPIYNPGESPPVEGFSNPSWVLLLRLAYGAGLPLEQVAQVLGALAGAGTLALLHGALLRLGVGRAAHWAGLLSLALAPPFVVWSTGGLETSLFGLLLLGCFLTLAAGPSTREGLRGLAAGLLAVLVATTRPEGFVWVLGLYGCARLARSAREGEAPVSGGRLRDSAFFGTYLLGFGAFLAWRLNLYGEWLPNTVRAKAGLSGAGLGRGARYLGASLLLTPTLLLALALAPLARGPRHLPLGAAGVLLGGLAYALAVGGDWMPFFRFLAPVLPFAALLVALGVQRLPALPGLGLALGAGLLGTIGLFDLHAAPRGLRESLEFRGFSVGYKTEWERWEIGQTNLQNFSRIGRGLAQVAQPTDSLTFGAIGAVGWYSNLIIHDRNGLVDREVALREASETSRSAGHDKRVPRAYFLDRRPTYFHALFAPFPIPGPESTEFRQAVGALAQKVFRTDPGEELLRQHSVPVAVALEPGADIPPGSSLVLLQRVDDPAQARAFWGP